MAKRKVQDINTKKRGEVFTPPSLVEEMLANIPDDGMEWDTTTLDPCVGATFIFPIFQMFNWCKKWGNENAPHFVSNLYAAEINEIALEYGTMIFERYIDMVIEKGVEFSKKHYYDNWQNIIDGYYDYSENLMEEI